MADKKFCSSCGKEIDSKAEICVGCGVRQAPTAANNPNGKSKIAAALFGILLGGFGAHKFYLGNVGLGILYLVFCWTGIPSVIGLIEGIIYLTMTDEAFSHKFDK